MPQASKVATNPLLPKEPNPEPGSNAHVKPAAVSGADGSVAVPVKVTPCPTSAFGELGVSEAIVGATFVTAIVACATSARPPSSVTRTFTTGEYGPSTAENVAVCPGVSNVPFPSRSQAYVSGPPSGSLPEAESGIELPSATAYGPPAFAVGGALSVSLTTDGSWSEAWSANSEFTWTTS